MIQTAEITFNLNEMKLPTIICRNEETGRQIQFTLVDDSGDPITIPNTATFTFVMMKPDGNIFETLIPSGILTVTDQLTASGGLGHYMIKITDTDTLIYSGQGGILIDDHLITDETIDSISEIYGLHFPEDFLTIYSSVAVLDDTTTSTLSTWSSEKIAEEIEAGTGADLIDDAVTSATKTWSSNKISAEVASKTSINDHGITHTETWSSDKIATELNGKPDVDDTAQNYADTWSSEKINAEIDDAGRIDDNRISDETTWSSLKTHNEISAITPGGAAYSTTEHAIGTWIDGSTVYERTINLGSFSIGSGGEHTVEAATNIYLLIDYDGYVVENSIMYALPDPSIRIKVDASKNLIFSGTAGWDVSSGYLTIRYTKTTP